jgi:hypothetical protein
LLLLPGLALIAAPPPAQAQSSAVLKWAEVDKPGIKGEIIIAPSEVNRIAASHDVVYAVDTANSKLHRSYNGGLTFTDITSALSNSGALLPAQEIAVAPDKPQYVAIVTNNRTKVYLSDNNGATWADTGLTGISGSIQCVAISNGYIVGSNLTHDIAVGTAQWGNATTDGQIWTLQVGASFGGWRDQGLTFAPAPGAEVSAIAFSPRYNSDLTILAVASTAVDAPTAATWLCIGQRDLSSQTTAWNPNPVQIGALLGDDIGVTDIVSSIALPSDYDEGGSSTSRKVLVNCDREPTNPVTALDNGIYRLDDATSPYQIQLLSNIAISSMAYFGTIQAGKLIAGDVNPETAYTTQVRRLADPFYATPPSTSWQTANQPPSGPGNAQVAWNQSGTVAFCGTGQLTTGFLYDESSFSQSQDNGNNWEQTSLINTDDIHISDIAPAPDSKSLFMATYSVAAEYVWRTAGEPLGSYWSRLLTIWTKSDRVILRLSPDYADDYTLYAAEVKGNLTESAAPGNSMMAMSHIRGNSSSWQKLYNSPGRVIDMAVEDKDTVYVALPRGNIRKSVDGGLTWQEPVDTGLSGINMLSVPGKGNILAGSSESNSSDAPEGNKVAYSTDGGASFTKIDKPVGYGPGDVQVVADAGYSQNRLIYAADNIADDGIWRWTIGTSTEWEQIDEPITQLKTGQRICGLAMGTEGTLYALRAEKVDGIGGGGMDRSLNPGEPYVWNIEFDILNRTLPVGTVFDPITIFPNNMPSLKLASGIGQNVVWAIDFANMLIYRFDDNICKSGPVTDGPDTVGCDPVSGRNQEVNLPWQQLSLSNQYELQIAKDDHFTIRVFGNDHIIPEDLTAPAVFFPAGGLVATPASEIANRGNLECGHAYHWRTRTRHATTGEFIRSPWSLIDTFTVKAGAMVQSPYLGVKLLSPDNGCLGCPVQPVAFSWTPYKEATRYEFILANDANLTQTIRDETTTTAYKYGGALDYNTDYFWRVRAIEVNGMPVSSDWSATFSFRTASAPIPIQVVPAPSVTPPWVWAVIGFGGALIIGLVVLIFRY